ncbi:MAG TPA: T9SS type A sorting domain-containing protein [Bacteroidales bacterium]|jgi:hypothetical protein|nr:T9SS type A sorting domain-containing protein [Bacteroidales bacterium]
MYRLLILLLSCLTLFAPSYSQIAEPGVPVSVRLPDLKSTSKIPKITLDMPETGSFNQQEGSPVRYGIYSDTLINLKSTGKIDIIPGAGKIWRLLISSPEARSIQVVFSTFQIPVNARLFLYDTDMKRIAGAFTSRNNQTDSVFTIADFEGNHVILEYFEPENAEFIGKLIIGSLGQAFSEPLFPEAGPGFININCPIGKDAQLAKHSVCKMSFRSGSYQVTCSGALINNTENDGKPYFLTANHCISTQAEATSLVTYFNFEVAGCNGELGTTPTLTGATLLVTGQPSDFTLLLLNSTPPANYQPFYGGWDANNEPVDHVTGIHVPFNETKKISIEYDSIYSNPISVTWDDDSRSPIGSHWIIGFDDGGTSQGSSGSPLFNSLNQIIGQLHGGDDEMAYYGKLSYSYTYKASNYHTMRHYLDPDSTGVTSMPGYFPSNNVPDAFFTTRFENVCHNAPIAFNDYSVFGPYEREWTIFPATYVFGEGTSGSSENPVIEFMQDTTYTISLNLLVENVILSTETLNIKSGENINLSVSSGTSAELCDCDFESIELTADGGDNFEWSILPGDENKITLSNATANKITVSRVPVYEADSSYTFGLRVIGFQAACYDTVNITYNLIRQVNDDIENAIELDYGISDYYSNICATIQEGEPIPPFVSCTTQNSWCNEYGTGKDIVENSVWFRFIASITGIVSISSTGMDNQIALYEANSYQSILNGDYTILGANDDRSDADYRPLIVNEAVHPGDTYWIQVDGSGGGLEDDFYINITEKAATSTDNNEARRMNVYPQPANDRVFISHPDWLNTLRVEIAVFNSAGIVVTRSAIETWNGTISVNTSDWAPGVYIAAVRTKDNRYVAQIIKR